MSTSAELFKHIDANGVTTYSDVEVPGSKIITPTTGNTITMPKYKAKQPIDPDERAYYVSFEIESPSNEATIRSNDGSLIVNLSLVPGLKVAEGHRISVFIDGKQVITKSTTLNNALKNIERGSHAIHAVVTDSKKKNLISSDSVTIYLKQFSKL